MLLAVSFLGLSNLSWAESLDPPSFDDPVFRRCVTWMLGGGRGALLENVCLDDYGIPPPSIFTCATKVRTGFLSSNDREACAILFEEQTKKVRAGYIR